MLQSVGSQKVGHDLVTEQQLSVRKICLECSVQITINSDLTFASLRHSQSFERWCCVNAVSS